MEFFKNLVKFKAGISLDPANMPDADATMLGLKTYDENDVTITASPSILSITYMKLVPRKMQDGSWRMTINGQVATSSLVDEIIITIPDSNFISLQSMSAGTGVDSDVVRMRTNSSNAIRWNGSQNRNGIYFSGDVALTAKPTWAD